MIAQELKDALQTNVSDFEIDYKALHYNLVPYLRGNDALKDIIQLEKTLKDMKKNIKTINKR